MLVIIILAFTYIVNYYSAPSGKSYHFPSQEYCNIGQRFLSN